MRKLLETRRKPSRHSSLFPAFQSGGNISFCRALSRTTAFEIFDRYLGTTELGTLGYSGLRRAGIARQLMRGIHPKAVLAASGYSHIRSIQDIAREYGLPKELFDANPHRQIITQQYLISACGFSKMIGRTTLD